MSVREKREVHFSLGSHLDLFWMGATRDCLDRGAEIMAEVIDLCKIHDSYCFYIESTVFAEYFLEKHPEWKTPMAELIHEGRLEIGASYADRVEHMHGGESILRHHVYGVRWVEKVFGIRPKSTCHSDLPGLSPQIPQICKKTGIEYYLRARGACAVYRWQAPDGSQIIYNNFGYGYGRNDLDHMATILDQTSDLPKIMVRGGYGDLEMPDGDIVKLVKDLRAKYPEIRFAISSPSTVLDCYTPGTTERESLPVIKGEWPFGWGSAATIEMEVFKAGGRLERLLLTAEKITSIAAQLGFGIKPATSKAHWWSSLGRYAREILPPDIPAGKELEEAWKVALYTQDHNYEGFSGAKSEYDRQTMLDYAVKYTTSILDSSLSGIAREVSRTISPRVGDVCDTLVVFNPLSWPRRDLVVLDQAGSASLADMRIVDSQGREVEKQTHGDSLYLYADDVPAMGYKKLYLVRPVDADTGHEPPSPVYFEDAGQWHESFSRWQNSLPSCTPPWYSAIRDGGKLRIESGQVSMTLDLCNGSISRIYDKSLGKELTGGDTSRLFGELISYEDPGIDVRYSFTGKLSRDSDQDYQVSMESSGPLFVTYLMEGSILDAKVEKRVTIYKHLPRIDLAVTIYWWGKKGEHIRLCLPFGPEGYKTTWYGAPFYSVEWPTMMDGIDDSAILGMDAVRQDEILAEDRRHFREIQQWIEVVYDNFGITLGVQMPSAWIDANCIEIPLLRSQRSCGDHNRWPQNPGKHTWRFSLTSHKGDWKGAKAYRSGWEHNNPLLYSFGGIEPDPGEASSFAEDEFSFYQVEESNVIVTTVKPAYDDPRSYIIRFFEVEGRSSEIHLRCFRTISDASEVNLLEETEKPLHFNGSTVTVPTGAFEIKTVKLRFAD